MKPSEAANDVYYCTDWGTTEKYVHNFMVAFRMRMKDLCIGKRVAIFPHQHIPFAH